MMPAGPSALHTYVPLLATTAAAAAIDDSERASVRLEDAKPVEYSK